MVWPSWKPPEPVKENWRKSWKVTAEIPGFPRFPAPQLRQFHGCSYTCIPRSVSISICLSWSMCSGHSLTPSFPPKPDLHTSLLPLPVEMKPCGGGLAGNGGTFRWHSPTPPEHWSAKARCESFLLSLLIQWKGKQISLNNWLFRAVRLLNGTEIQCLHTQEQVGGSFKKLLLISSQLLVSASQLRQCPTLS